jgi:hypothetical protein
MFLPRTKLYILGNKDCDFARFFWRFRRRLFFVDVAFYLVERVDAADGCEDVDVGGGEFFEGVVDSCGFFVNLFWCVITFELRRMQGRLCTGPESR